MKKKQKTEELMVWRVHTANLLGEILKNQSCAILHTPLDIFRRTLVCVGERASELNDPVMNALMCLLTIYEIDDPLVEGYDPKRVREVLKCADEWLRKRVQQTNNNQTKRTKNERKVSKANAKKVRSDEMAESRGEVDKSRYVKRVRRTGDVLAKTGGPHTRRDD